MFKRKSLILPLSYICGTLLLSQTAKVANGQFGDEFGLPPSSNCPGSKADDLAKKILSPVESVLQRMGFDAGSSFDSSVESLMEHHQNNCPKEEEKDNSDEIAQRMFEEFFGIPAGPPFWQCTDDKDEGCRTWCRDTNPLARDGYCQAVRYRVPTTCACDEVVECKPRKHDPLCKEKCRKRYHVETKVCRVTTGQPEFEARRECICDFSNGTYAFS